MAYINSDSNGRGYFNVEGSHTLEKFSNDVARDITDPETKLSVWTRARLRDISNARTAEQREEIRKRADLRIPALGSGSDYTTFLQHDGVASLNFGFGGEDGLFVQILNPQGSDAKSSVIIGLGGIPR